MILLHTENVWFSISVHAVYSVEVTGLYRLAALAHQVNTKTLLHTCDRIQSDFVLIDLIFVYWRFAKSFSLCVMSICCLAVCHSGLHWLAYRNLMLKRFDCRWLSQSHLHCNLNFCNVYTKLHIQHIYSRHECATKYPCDGISNVLFMSIERRKNTRIATDLCCVIKFQAVPFVVLLMLAFSTCCPHAFSLCHTAQLHRISGCAEVNNPFTPVNILPMSSNFN